MNCAERRPFAQELKASELSVDCVQLRPAVFLDRDGTLIEDRGHLRSPSEVIFFPNTIDALGKLQDEFLLFIVTHQPGVAEGVISTHDVERVNSHVVSQLAEMGTQVLETYVCPHKRSDGCACIKPKPYFLHQAAEDYRLDLRRSFVVGDHPHDVELAASVGARGVYVCTGHGLKHLDEVLQSEPIVGDIDQAAEWILRYCQA